MCVFYQSNCFDVALIVDSVYISILILECVIGLLCSGNWLLLLFYFSLDFLRTWHAHFNVIFFIFFLPFDLTFDLIYWCIWWCSVVAELLVVGWLIPYTHVCSSKYPQHYILYYIIYRCIMYLEVNKLEFNVRPCVITSFHLSDKYDNFFFFLFGSFWRYTHIWYMNTKYA